MRAYASTFGLRTRLIASIGPGLLLCSATVQADTPVATTAGTEASDTGVGGSGGIEEIIVTAERRAASLQDTPIAISAVSGEQLQSEHVINFEGLTVTMPDVQFSESAGSARIFIRGIGLDALAPGADPRVAIYTDGVYNSRPQAAFASFYDVDRIEVLKGPQGTLYGRNATAGAINILSRDPGTTVNGYATETFGNYGLIQTEGAIGGPLANTVSARLSFQTVNRDGFGKNIETGMGVDDVNKRAVRGKLKFEPSDSATIVLEGDYSRVRDHEGGFHFLRDSPGRESFSEAAGFTVPANVRDYAGQGPNNVIDAYGASATGIFHLGDWTLTSVSGYRHLFYDLSISADETTSNYLPVSYTENSNQFTQEFRVAKTFGPVDTQFGVYYFNETDPVQTRAQVNGAYFGLPAVLYDGSLYGGSQTTNAFAAFTQETVHLTDKLGVDLGVRYSNEKRSEEEYSQFDLSRPYVPGQPDFVPGVARFGTKKKSWNSWDPKITIHYKITNDILVYATRSQGFKSGGFNVGFLQSAFSPEKLVDYEAGFKGDFFNRRLRVDLAGFHYNYSNIQVNTTEGVQLITVNAGAAKVDGFEADITALPVPNLKINFAASWLNARYTRFISSDPGRPELGVLNLAGNKLEYAPRFKVNTEVGYTFDTKYGSITPRANLSWTDKIYFSQFNVPWVSQPSLTLLDLYADYDAGKGWSANAFVKNATNKLYALAGTVSSNFIGYQVVGQLGEPRTYGVSITKRF